MSVVFAGSAMKIAVVKETGVGERRVALVPNVINSLVSKGLEVRVESGAGNSAFFSNAAYEEVGAQILSDPEILWAADVVLKVSAPTPDELKLMRSGSIFVGMLDPLVNLELVQDLAGRQVTVMAMELIPRISRAQSMDVLSSQASLAGYQATLIAASALPKYFPMLTTAAGTIPPAKVFVIGAGVAGLQAIATARRLGAQVSGFDIRPEVKEQVQSLGAKFVELQLEEETQTAGGYAKELSDRSQQMTQELIAQQVRQSDAVITTARVPGKKAPLLVTAEMVEQMKPGSVIVDMAADQGGNCACSEAGQEVVHHGVTILGPQNLPATMPIHASELYAKNISTFLMQLIKEGQLQLDFEDEIINSACLTHAGEVRNARVKAAIDQRRELQTA